MTDRDLAVMDAALAARLKPWIGKASMLILSELSAARAHGESALTGRLKQTRDGRPSARRILRSPSYLAALGHIQGLQDRLCGVASDSLDGLIRDARAWFYGDSVRLWTPFIPPEYRAVPEPAPTKEGERLMRGAIIHGYDLRREIAPAIEVTKNQLFAALNSGGRKAVPLDLARDRLALWFKRAVDRMDIKVASALSDSDVAIHHATGLLLIAPQYRPSLDNPAGDGLHF